MVTFDDFAKIDIRVGTVVSAIEFKEVRNPAYKLEIDFGDEIGIKKSSAQITNLYTPKDLVGRKVVAVVNFPVKQIANYMSEVLVLGAYTDKGVALLGFDKEVSNGSKIG